MMINNNENKKTQVFNLCVMMGMRVRSRRRIERCSFDLHKLFGVDARVRTTYTDVIATVYGVDFTPETRYYCFI